MPAPVRSQAHLCMNATRRIQNYHGLPVGSAMIRTHDSGCIEPEFVPVASADGWQISNPPIFSMAPLRASLSIFDEAGGMEPLRAKSVKLTGFLEFLIEQIGSKKFSDHHAVGPECTWRAIVDPGARASETVTPRTYRRWCEMRFSRTERDPRRTGAAVQHVPRSLAIRADSAPHQ